MAVKELEIDRASLVIIPEPIVDQLRRELRTRSGWLTSLYGDLHELNLGYDRQRNSWGHHQKIEPQHALDRATKFDLIRQGERLQALTKMELRKVKQQMRGGV